MKKQTVENYRRKQKKTIGVPKLTLAVDAAYDNKWGGSLMAYAYDPNPARFDRVYLKLKEGFEEILSLKGRENPQDHVAYYYRKCIMARQMDEATYNHILRMPVHLLEREFAIKFKTDASLRRKIDENYEYCFDSQRREWTVS